MRLSAILTKTNRVIFADLYLSKVEIKNKNCTFYTNKSLLLNVITRNKMLKNNYLYITLFVIIGFSRLGSQDYEAFYPNFFENGNKLELATAGGLRNAKFSNFDFNGDGIKDIYAFDRTSGRSLCFVNLNDAEAIRYRYAPEYEVVFPKISNWALLYDFNKDGIEDLFCLPTTPGIPGVEVWRGSKVNNMPVFTKMKTPFYDVVMLPAGNGFTNLYNALTDIPAILDVDGDGDTDILTFEIDGSYLNYHQNQAVEKGFGIDTFVMLTKDICFGKFYENMFSEELILSPDGQSCAKNFQEDGNPRHSGSTVMAYDDDCDGDMDLILGDVANTKLFFLKNGGTKNAAWITSQDLHFPSYDVPIEMNLFLAAFHLDVNGDGKRDLIATPNETDGGVNANHIWLYINKGSDCAPIFELYSKNFLVDEMVSLGAKSDVAVGDVTGDGLADLIIGGNGHYLPGTTKISRLNLYKNTGSATQPEFTLLEQDYLNMSVLTNYGLALSPALADMDADGDLDLWVGDGNGRLYYFTNGAGAGNMAQYTYTYPFNNIFVGQDAKPCIRDVSGDGLPDLLVGEQNNELNLFVNTGTKTNPVFGNVPDQKNFGQLFSTTDFNTFNNSIAPFYHDGKKMAYIGFEDGRLSLYEWEGDPLTGKWQLLDTNVGKVHRGNKLNSEIFDINSDGRMDLILGNFGGGVQFFSTPYQYQTSGIYQQTLAEIKIYPNPFVNVLTILSQDQPMNYVLFDAAGKSVMTGRLLNPLTQLNVSDLPVGFYILQVADGKGNVGYLKLVK